MRRQRIKEEWVGVDGKKVTEWMKASVRWMGNIPAASVGTPVGEAESGVVLARNAATTGGVVGSSPDSFFARWGSRSTRLARFQA